MRDWQEFIGRTPEAYNRWIVDSSREAAQLEIVRLIQLVPTGKKIFVDTNIPLDVLHEVSDYHRVAIMLSPQSMSVGRFFDREDPEKKFLYEVIQDAVDPVAAMENYRNCLAQINSPEHYEEFAQSGFFTYVREESSTIEQAMHALEEHFGLGGETDCDS